MTIKWPTVALGEISDFQGGSQPPKSQFISEPREGYVRLLQIRDFKSDDKAVYIPEDLSRRRCEDTDIMIGRYGASVGQIHRGKAGAYNVALIKTIPNTKAISRDFSYLYLISDLFRKPLMSVADRSAQAGFSKKDISDFQVPLPPLAEQKRIVAILDEAFAGIATAVAHAEKNLANARELWVGAVASACSGASTKGWRQENSEVESAELLLMHGLARRRNQRGTGGRHKEAQPPLVDAKTAIPDTWVWASPEQLSTNIVDCPHSTPKWADEGLICLRTTNFRPGFLDLNSVRYVSEASYGERVERLEPKPGDVLYSREGGILGIACTFPDGLKACLGQRMMLFRLDDSLVYSRYFVCVLNSPLILGIVNRLTGGAASPHINIRDIRAFPIPLPPFSEQQEIVKALDLVWASVQRLESLYQQKLDSLAELKQSILQKAFAGELTAHSDEVLAEGGA